MSADVISSQHLTLIVIATLMGTIARLLTLKEDYRQYPSYPNGYLIHLITGFVAASLGAVAVPALLTKNFVAVTFLSLAIQQFRDVRKIEKNSLEDLEETEFVRRGSAYIDGIAKTFESRNYFALVVALATGIAVQAGFGVFKGTLAVIFLGAAAGLAAFLLIWRFTKGLTVGDIAQVVPGNVRVENSELYVDDIFVTNLIGTENAQKLLREEALAVVIKPNEDHYRIALDNYGQRQAILFEATRAMGVKRYAFTRKDFQQGRIVVVLVPIKPEQDALVEVVKKAPLLENTKKADQMIKTPLEGRNRR